MLTKEHLEVSENLKLMIRKELNALADFVAVDTCKSWEEYLKITGQIAGLARAEGYLHDILNKLDKMNE
jgi:hypothetical protein